MNRSVECKLNDMLQIHVDTVTDRSTMLYARLPYHIQCDIQI